MAKSTLLFPIMFYDLGVYCIVEKLMLLGIMT